MLKEEAFCEALHDANVPETKLLDFMFQGTTF